MRKTVFQLAALKASRPDGMFGILYHHCWDVVGTDLVDVVLAFFESGRMLKELNHTHLVLIPKVPHPESIE